MTIFSKYLTIRMDESTAGSSPHRRRFQDCRMTSSHAIVQKLIWIRTAAIARFASQPPTRSGRVRTRDAKNTAATSRSPVFVAPRAAATASSRSFFVRLEIRTICLPMNLGPMAIAPDARRSSPADHNQARTGFPRNTVSRKPKSGSGIWFSSPGRSGPPPDGTRTSQAAVRESAWNREQAATSRPPICRLAGRMQPCWSEGRR